MTDPISNSVNTPATQVTNNSNYSPSTEKKAEEPKTENVPKVETKDIPADKILDFLSGMAAQNIQLKLSPAVLVARYNTPEQIQRVSSLVGDIFQAGVIAWREKLEAEMGAAPAYQGLSEADKNSLSAMLYANETLE